MLICSGSKIYLLPLLPVSILIDSLLPSRKPLVRPLLCCIFCSSASVCLLRIAGVRRLFPISLSAPGFGRPIWLVQLSLTAGSPCGCSAAYSPSAYLTLPKHLFFIFHFPSPAHSFQAPLDSLRCSTELVGSALYSVGTRFVENLLS